MDHWAGNLIGIAIMLLIGWYSVYFLIKEEIKNRNR